MPTRFFIISLFFMSNYTKKHLIIIAECRFFTAKLAIFRTF